MMVTATLYTIIIITIDNTLLQQSATKIDNAYKEL